MKTGPLAAEISVSHNISFATSGQGESPADVAKDAAIVRLYFSRTIAFWDIDADTVPYVLCQ